MNYTDSFITDKVRVFGRVSEKRRCQVKSANAARWQTNKENPEQAVCIPGSRIMNMGELSKAVKELTSHSAQCGGYFVLEGELSHIGLAVVLLAKCSKCQVEFTINSSRRITNSTNCSKKWHINLAAVLGQMSSGGGNARLEHILTTMGIPSMRKELFQRTE